MTTSVTIKLDSLPIIALVGRVNVGKSTLFNRLIEQDKAIVSQIPGTTRTNNEGLVIWRGKQIRLIDTGGLTFTDQIPLEADILRQTESAMKKADIIVFVTDAQDGILPQERELAKRIRRIISKPVILLANKTDSKKIENNLTEPEWLRLGLGEPFAVSSANGRNLGNFLDLVFKILNKGKKRPKLFSQNDDVININIIGKPNVGKSSLFNQLIGQEKVIVSPIPHTTREPHDILVSYKYQQGGKTIEQMINFVDTAGIRRKSRVEGSLERAGIRKSIESVESSDIVLFVIDGNDTISTQDRQLGGLLERKSKSVILLINKWDLTNDNSDHNRQEVKQMIYSYFPHLDFAPLVFVSGKTGYRVQTIFPLIMEAWRARQTIIPEETLKEFLHEIVRIHKPSRGKGVRQPSVLGLRQITNNPPIFEALIKANTSLHRSYINFMENKLRERFDFFATPIVIRLTKQKKR